MLPILEYRPDGPDLIFRLLAVTVPYCTAPDGTDGVGVGDTDGVGVGDTDGVGVAPGVGVGVGPFGPSTTVLPS